MIKVAIAGAAGRMGQSLVKAVSLFENMELTVAVEHEDNPTIGKDPGIVAGINPTGITIKNKLANEVDRFDVLIDFTRPEPSLIHVDICRQSGNKIVIGTTGFNEDHRQQITRAAGDTSIVLAPNMSVGVNLTFKLLEIAAEVMGNYTDIEIIEAHHRHKVDAPSGTALRMGEVIAGALGKKLKDCAIYGREGQTGERNRDTIGFSTIRAGDIVGEHTVMFADEGERVEISHKATNRMTFANGAMRAASWIMGKQVGLYDMQDVLGLKS